MNKKTILIRAFLMFSLAITMFSCKETNDIGLELGVENEFLGAEYTDTISISAYSFIEDNLQTDEQSLSLLGSYKDPVFGTVKASFYTQLALEGNNIDFGTNVIADSIVLSLDYAGYYGDTTIMQTVRIFEVTEDMYYDSNYYSNQQTAFSSTELGSLQFIPKISDSVEINGSKRAPSLNVKLNNSFADYLIANEASMSENDAFISFFKGIHISCESISNDGAILYFSPTSDYSRVTLYYHNDDGNMELHFNINETCARYGYYDHEDYQDADPDLLSLLNGDTSIGEERLYIQSLGGVRTHLHFPYLKNLCDSYPTIVINRAELLIPAQLENNQSDLFPQPSALGLVYMDKEDVANFLPDYLYEGSVSFGGFYDEENEEYIFTLTRYIQDIITGVQNDNGLEILANLRAINANRLEIFGTKPLITNDDKRLKLKLTYTIIK